MNIAILSRSAGIYSTRALYEAAINRGHKTQIIDLMLLDLVIGKPNEIMLMGQAYKGIDAIIPRVAHQVTQNGANIIRQFCNQGVITTLSADSLLIARNKLISYQMLSAGGIQIPRTVIINNHTQIGEILETWSSYPMIVKLLKGTHGLGVLKLDNKAIAENIIETFMTLNTKFLLQDYISESKGQDIRAIVIGDKVVAAMRRMSKSGDFRSNLHRGGTSEIVNLSTEETEIAIKATQCLNLEISGVDILQTKNGPMVLEVNASPGLEGIQNTTNIDIADLIIEYLENKYNSHN